MDEQPLQYDWEAVTEEALEKRTVQLYDKSTLGSVELAQTIDHTLLKLDATREQIDQLCNEAIQHKFKSVCVRLKWVPRAKEVLRDTPVLITCVVGFHEGNYRTAEKVNEATAAVHAGAKELDMVLNYTELKSGNYSSVYADILEVRKAAPKPIVLKVILETSQLSSRQTVTASKIAQAAGADFVKTSTGFNGRGASVYDVQLMKSIVGMSMKVKASGGIRNAGDAIKMIEAGADRIGASSGVAILAETGNSGEKGENGQGSGY
ncbi:hypothetical protein MMC25_001967 [Agyrium rufum]|nr:hypothetical protein [Agyrium rufum]